MKPARRVLACNGFRVQHGGFRQLIGKPGQGICGKVHYPRLVWQVVTPFSAIPESELSDAGVVYKMLFDIVRSINLLLGGNGLSLSSFLSVAVVGLQDSAILPNIEIKAAMCAPTFIRILDRNGIPTLKEKLLDSAEYNMSFFNPISYWMYSRRGQDLHDPKETIFLCCLSNFSSSGRRLLFLPTGTMYSSKSNDPIQLT